MYLGPVAVQGGQIQATCAWRGCGRPAARLLALVPAGRPITPEEGFASLTLLCPTHEAAAQETRGYSEPDLRAWRETTLQHSRIEE